MTFDLQYKWLKIPHSPNFKSRQKSQFGKPRQINPVYKISVNLTLGKQNANLKENSLFVSVVILVFILCIVKHNLLFIFYENFFNQQLTVTTKK